MVEGFKDVKNFTGFQGGRFVFVSSNGNSGGERWLLERERESPLLLAPCTYTTTHCSLPLLFAFLSFSLFRRLLCPSNQWTHNLHYYYYFFLSFFIYQWRKNAKRKSALRERECQIFLRGKVFCFSSFLFWVLLVAWLGSDHYSQNLEVIVLPLEAWTITKEPFFLQPGFFLFN